MSLTLEQIEQLAAAQGLLLRLQLGGAGPLQTLKVAVARRSGDQRLVMLGELKGWCTLQRGGLRLDTMRVQGEDTQGVGSLIWAATFAWALETTPCRVAWLLAIRDEPQQHRRLVRYFRTLGFEPQRELGAAVWDLPRRLIWGGSGLLMRGDCAEGLRRCQRRLQVR